MRADGGLQRGNAALMRQQGRRPVVVVPTAARKRVVNPGGDVEGDLRPALQMLQAGQGGAASCVERYLRPVARVKTGVLLGRNRAASACVDLSDGLADGVARIAESSGVGISLDEAALPIEPAARDWFVAHAEDPLQATLAGGDDYELLFTARPRSRGRLKAAMLHGGVAITRIGVCTADGLLTLKMAATGALAALPQGFTHFR